MAILVAIIIVMALSIAYDHLCYWKRLDEFESKANEFSTMYNLLAPKVINGDPDDPDIEEFIFEGKNYCATVKKNDLSSLYSQLKPYIKDVLDSYDKIGERYLSLMDDETQARIYELHEIVEEIEGIIRYESWLKGIK